MHHVSLVTIIIYTTSRVVLTVAYFCENLKREFCLFLLLGVDILVLAQSHGRKLDRNTREVAGKRFCPLPIRLVEAKRLGRKTGKDN